MIHNYSKSYTTNFNSTGNISKENCKKIALAKQKLIYYLSYIKSFVKKDFLEEIKNEISEFNNGLKENQKVGTKIKEMLQK